MRTNTYRAVTTFNAASHPWGATMLSSAIINLPEEVKISGIVERSDLVSVPNQYKTRMELLEFEDSCPTFKKFTDNIPETVKERAKKSFRFDVARFAHKIFAISSVYNRMNEDILIWMDADISVHKKLPLSALDHWLPEPHLFSYLGRHHLANDPAFSKTSYPECGYMMFRRHQATKAFIDKLINIYVTNLFENHTEWHDSYLIHDTLQELQVTDQTFGFDICSLGLIPLTKKDHVFIASVLGGYMDHFKGNRKANRKSPELAERERFLRLIAPR